MIEDTACITAVANVIVASKVNGYPELGLPVLDPLSVAEMNIEQGTDQPVSIKLKLWDAQLTGLSKLKFSSITGLSKNSDKDKVELKFKIPVLSIRGKYKIDGKILVIPVQGNGNASLIFCKNIQLCNLLLNVV